MEPIIDYSVFKKNLRDLIDSRGMMVVQVADETGISKITLSRYLNGHRIPDLEYVIRLAKFFNVSVDWMLGLTGEKFDILPPDIQSLVNLYSVASPDDRKVVEAVLSKYREEQ